MMVSDSLFSAKRRFDVIELLDYDADILHCSEWQTAMIPVYLKTFISGEQST